MVEWYWLVIAFFGGCVFGGSIVFIEPLGDPEGFGAKPVFDGRNGNGYQPTPNKAERYGKVPPNPRPPDPPPPPPVRKVTETLF